MRIADGVGDTNTNPKTRTVRCALVSQRHLNVAQWIIFLIGFNQTMATNDKIPEAQNQRDRANAQRRPEGDREPN